MKDKWTPNGFKRLSKTAAAHCNLQPPEYFNSVWDVAYDALELLEECKPPTCFHPDVKAKIDAFLAQHLAKEFVVKTVQDKIAEIVDTPSCRPDVQQVGRILAAAIDVLRKDMEHSGRSA